MNGRLNDRMMGPMARVVAGAAVQPQSLDARWLIGVLPGEGVGPEVVGVAMDVLQALCRATGHEVEIRTGGAIGKPALSATGKSLTDETVSFCEQLFDAGGVLFCGPGGARFVYELRARFDLFCKFTPLAPLPALADIGPLRPEGLRGVDIVAVRENVGGLYFGDWGARDGGAYHRFEYHRGQVERILQVAARLAGMRRRRLSLVIKQEGIPAISELWLDCLAKLDCAGELDTEILDIDNAVYQLIARPQSFDVIVSPNMFGDVLADCGGLLLGSRGLSHSGNFSADGRAVYQTGHGAAHDIAGSDIANPVGQLLALAMLLEQSLGWQAGAVRLRAAIDAVLCEGWRTPDMAAPDSRVTGTRDLGRRIAAAVEAGPCAPCIPHC